MFFFVNGKYKTVKENYRRQGHGEALLKAAIEKCKKRKVQRISLHVDPLRTAAMTIYKKLGFQVDSLVEGYYSSDRNAYRMHLDLQIKIVFICMYISLYLFTRVYIFTN